MKTIKRILILYLFTTHYLSIGQAISKGNYLLPTIFSASPNAASLGSYGQVPVNLFSGLPNIDINLYNIKINDFQLPISISYNLASVKPEERPGWVGLGWNLNAGGAITRLVKGGVDEVISDNTVDPTVFSYFNHFNELNTINWDSTSKLEEYSNWLKSVAPTKFAAIPAPDEFIFNVNGLSGSFYKNHEGIWVVKSNQHIDFRINEEFRNNFKLYEVGNHIANDRSFDITRIFYGFTLTTDDGTQYVFGKDPNALEFTASPNVTADTNNPNFVVKTWYLTKIILPSNKTITFQYKTNYNYSQSDGDTTNKAVFKQYVSSDIMKYWTHDYSRVSMTESSSSGNITNKILERTYVVYLDKITTADTEIVFNNSLANDLDYDLHNSSWGQYLPEYVKDLSVSYLPQKHWYKLNNFIVKSTVNNSQIYKVDFKYLENTSSRLFLTGIDEVGLITTSLPSKKYSFEYNSLSLPPYNSQKTDHWGFFNNTNFFETVSPPSNSLYYTDDQIRNYYYLSRNPNPSVLEAGTLTKIVYPTGGFTKFYYEPHDFSKVVDRNNTAFSLVAANSEHEIGGGLRIRKIVSDPLNSGTLLTKEYYYIKNYKDNGTESSGILSGRPSYIEEVTVPEMHFFKLSSNSFNQLNDTNGNHITYTNVIEKLQDGSLTEYTYSNHDNGYMDKLANRYYFKYSDASGNTFGFPTEDTKNLISKKISFNSLSAERGNLLSEKKYNADKKIVEETNFVYNDDLNRFSDKIRSIDFSETVIGTIQDGLSALGGPVFEHLKSLSKLAVYSTYSHQIHLKKKDNILYDLTNNTQTTNTTEYIYSNDNEHHHLKEEKTYTSKNDISQTKYYYYALDVEMQNEPSKSDLVLKHMTGVVIDNQLFKNDLKLSEQKTTYSKDASTANLLLPKSVYEAKFPNNIPFTTNVGNLEKKLTYDFYDTSGNLTQYTPEGGSPVSIVWGYNKTQPIAKIENVTNAQLVSALGVSDFSAITEAQLSSLNSLRTNSTFTSSMITTYTYQPLVGVTSITDPKGDTVYYTYDGLGRLQYVKDAQGKLLTDYQYHYKN